MNFFEHQEKARSKTTRLMILFFIAVALIVVALYFVVRILGWYLLQGQAESGMVQPLTWWDPLWFAAVAAGVVLFVGVASLYKVVSLRGGGGASVAVMLGAVQVDPAKVDFKTKRFLNVVEEMAIASGMPMPDVFVMESEPGINAFTAGYTPDNAVVCVTRGALDTLTRDELQGVVAHEFSHIFNGDMRLNIKLMGVLFGILAIGIIGQIMARTSFYSGGSSSRSRRSGGNAAMAIMLAGLAIIVIGYIGTFLGRLIQTAVSRQREFLADSSAVQFTRNPHGIGGALKKIGGYASGSQILAPNASQAGHFFFGQGSRLKMFTGLLATHPNLGERIRRIDPDFGGDFGEVGKLRDDAASGAAMGFAGGGPVAGGPIAVDADSVPDRVGRLSDEDVDAGRRLLESIPEPLYNMVRETDGAVTLVYGLLMDENAKERSKQLGLLKSEMDTPEMKKVLDAFELCRTLDPRVRLPLLDLSMPALRKLPAERLTAFVRMLQDLAAADGKITLFEFTMQWLVNHRLFTSRKTRGKIVFVSFGPLVKDADTLLGAIARQGNPDDPQAAQQAFDQGVSGIGDLERKKPSFNFDAPTSFGDVARALDRFALASYPVKKNLIDAAACCAFADKTVTPEEGEILRVLSTALDCPMPPFVTVIGIFQ